MPVEGRGQEFNPGNDPEIGYSMTDRVRRALIQALCLLALGMALGASSHEIRGRSLSWISSWSKEEVGTRHLEGLEEISLQEAWRTHQAGKSLFLDARDPASFQAGHLPGAINVPPSEAQGFSGEIRALAQAGMIPISYCDGVDCPLSAELARHLKEMGIEGVRVLVNGWSRWRDSGYPVEEGGS
ncbi:MAG: rhodanese-like domain-containing protein [Thermodesulfobacteriota bacterium]